MRAIHQFAPVLVEHDAIGNEAATLAGFFRQWGMDGRLYAERQGALFGLPVKPITDFQDHGEGAYLLVHYGHGSELWPQVWSQTIAKVMLYHRITPAAMLAGLDPIQALRSQQGLRELSECSRYVKASVAHAEVGAAELRAAGHPDVRTIPYLLRDALYSESGPHMERDPFQLLMVGRVMPHKRVEHGILAADYLRQRYSEPWHLVIAGDTANASSYLERIIALRSRLGLDEAVRIAGRISQRELVREYRRSTALLFASEHEGFGVPLIEAMRLDVPVVAYGVEAVPEVLGEAGVLLEDTNPMLLGESARMASRSRHRETILRCQAARVAELSPSHVAGQWRDLLQGLERALESDGKNPGLSG